jgi:hypothetical protein
MSAVTLRRVHRTERRPLGAIIWVRPHAGDVGWVLRAPRRRPIDAVWTWLRDLPLVVELLIWVALFPCLREDSAPQCQQSSSHT